MPAPALLHGRSISSLGVGAQLGAASSHSPCKKSAGAGQVLDAMVILGHWRFAMIEVLSGRPFYALSLRACSHVCTDTPVRREGRIKVTPGAMVFVAPSFILHVALQCMICPQTS